MHYYLYEIKNILNGKIYVGVHVTKDLNDGYMGSGKVIKNAMKKHGADNFIKTVLEEFDAAEQMYAREKEVVTDEFLSRSDVYNLRRGGHGGFDHINKNLNDQMQNTRKANARKTGTIYGKITGRITGPKNLKKAHKEGKLRYDGMLGKTHNEHTKALIAAKTSIAQAGIKNSQYGTIWITNGIVNKKVKSTDGIPVGWKRGRIY